jgi:hypothetical protein
MAPPKAHLPQRIGATDFLGINWSKPSYHLPFTNQYPCIDDVGSHQRMLSNPRLFGRSARQLRAKTRSLVLLLPTAVLGGIFLTDASVYDVYYFANFWTGITIPQSVVDNKLRNDAKVAREMPGVRMKHLWGGQVSIPGSQINIGYSSSE